MPFYNGCHLMSINYHGQTIRLLAHRVKWTGHATDTLLLGRCLWSAITVSIEPGFETLRGMSRSRLFEEPGWNFSFDMPDGISSHELTPHTLRFFNLIYLPLLCLPVLDADFSSRAVHLPS